MWLLLSTETRGFNDMEPSADTDEEWKLSSYPVVLKAVNLSLKPCMSSRTSSTSLGFGFPNTVVHVI